MRRVAAVVVLLLAAIGGWYAWRGHEVAPGPRGTPPLSPAGLSQRATQVAEAPRRKTPLSPAEMERDFPLAARLNAEGGSIAQDLEALQHIFEAWQTNFPREGNPTGENAEITAALTGRNRLDLVLIPPGHPALNSEGELCDRWGTPFRFHQISGSRMEVFSAGPDRKFSTEDDAVWKHEEAGAILR